MSPIKYDLAICLISLLAGVVMFFKIGAFDRDNYTPMVFAMTVASGILYWLVLLLVTSAAIYHVPSWLDTKTGWQGTWGYTGGRILNGICWLLMLATLRWALPLVRACKLQGMIKS